MLLKELLKDYKDAIIHGNDKDITVENLFIDSRQTVENGLFFCLVGGRSNSHEFVEQAILNGAVAVVTEKKLSIDVPQVIVSDSRAALGKLSSIFFGEPSKKMKVIGITGTNGKTTTSYMLSSILKTAEKKVGVIGTLGIRCMEEKMDSLLTTPDPITLQETLSYMVNKGIEYVIMEVSAHALYYKKVAGIQFYGCIFTNLTQDHLDFFQTMQGYKQAKLQLFPMDVCPFAILNGDDTVGREIALLRKENDVLFYGLDTPTDCFAVITHETLRGTECMFNINDKLCRVSLSLAGTHNVYNALAAGACAYKLGVSIENVAKGLSAIKSVEGRLERIENSLNAEIYVDFAHTPDGLGNVLDALRKHCKGRLICVFGCGGNRDKEKRALMGEIAAKKSDFTILTSDNPRYEDPLDIISEIEKGYRRFSVRYVVVPDRKKGLEYALDCLNKGDVLLIAGKGAEEYQEIMGIKYPFKDQDIIEKLLKKNG